MCCKFGGNPRSMIEETLVADLRKIEGVDVLQIWGTPRSMLEGASSLTLPATFDG